MDTCVILLIICLPADKIIGVGAGNHNTAARYNPFAEKIDSRSIGGVTASHIIHMND
jgi:hypothetical protein